MQDLMTMLILTALAGLCMPLGALFAQVEHIHSNWLENELRHSVIAFAGGALLSAVALVLVPESIEHLSVFWSCLFFILGGVIFLCMDIYLHKKNTPASQLAAMLTDFIPESLALGAIFSMGGGNAILLVLLIGLQNLPEGFNAYRELMQSGKKSARKLVWVFVGFALLGPVAGFIGYEFLANESEVLAGIMLCAAGGILYSVFQDIAPNVKLEQHWFPPMGAILGFVLGLMGHMLSS